MPYPAAAAISNSTAPSAITQTLCRSAASAIAVALVTCFAEISAETGLACSFISVSPTSASPSAAGTPERTESVSLLSLCKSARISDACW